MPAPETPQRDPAERGGITILVVLSLLVLLTIASLAMSKNAIRQGITAGTIRQAAQAQNMADAGIEWTVFWVAPDFSGNRAAPTGGALALQTARDTLQANANFGFAGSPISTADMTVSSAGGITQSFDVAVTLMGQVTPPGGSPNPSRSSASALSATALNLWGVRTNGYLAYSGGPTFIHRREAWFTTATAPVAVP